MTQPTIVLTLIMKNEEEVVGKCIEAALPFVDAVVVVDTGSTDKSIEVAETARGSLPGKVVQLPWKGFAESRNDALEIAKEFGDYALMIDADSELVADEGFTKEDLARQLMYPAHAVHIGHGETRYSRPALTHRNSGVRYRGIVHEFIELPEGMMRPHLVNGIQIINNGLGKSDRNRNPRKYFDDAVAIRDALETEPESLRPRYTFYLAQSYMNGGMLNLALECYEKRLTMGGWIEELYISALGIARLREQLNHSEDSVIAAYLAAYNILPSRAESLCDLARYTRLRNKWNIAHMSGSWALNIREPEDALFSDLSVYRWRLRYELSISSWYVGKFEDGLRLSEELLSSDYMNEGERKATEGNRELYRKRLGIT